MSEHCDFREDDRETFAVEVATSNADMSDQEVCFLDLLLIISRLATGLVPGYPQPNKFISS
jgi:hypothetical protein